MLDNGLLLQKIQDWNQASTWRIAYGIGRDFREERKRSEESFRIANDTESRGGSPASIELFRDAARQHAETAEKYRLQAIEFHRELTEIANAVRHIAPECLSLAHIPGINFLEESPEDVVQFARIMIELESKLLVKSAESLNGTDASDWPSVTKAANDRGINPGTVSRYARGGKVKSQRVGKELRVCPASLDKYLEENPSKQRGEPRK